MRKFLSMGGALAFTFALALSPVVASGATGTTVTVTNTDLVSYPTMPSAGQFMVIDQSSNTLTGTGGPTNVPGPGIPPLGVGSLQMSVTGTSDHWSVYTNDWAGTKLADITSLSYWSYSNNSTTAPTLQVVISPGTASPTGTNAGCLQQSHYSTLNVEPYLQPGSGVVPYTWQYWNALASNAVVWGTHLSACMPESPRGINMSTFLSYYPNATILPLTDDAGVGFNVGSGWGAMTGAADALTVGTASTGPVTYNFEPNAGNRPFTSRGTASESSGSAPECQFSLGGCTVNSNGIAISSHLGIGAYSSSLTVNWMAAYSNGQNGYCAPASGTGVFEAANGDTLNQTQAGIVCEVGATGVSVAHTFSGYFADTGGTGRFVNATGSGIVVGGDNGAGTSYYTETGTIAY